MTTVTKKLYGTMENGTEVYEYRLTNSHGSYVTVLDYGATITSIVLSTPQGPVDVCLGYKTLPEYQNNGGYLGACIGRVGNRIGKARFTLNGKEYTLAANDGNNHLHGGNLGFDKHIFTITEIEGGIRAGRRSPDGEENYPGNLDVTVDYLFDDDNKLTLIYNAVSDADTLCNLTNHTYFNLSGEADGSILDHTLTLNASAFTANDEECQPNGTIASVDGTCFDFRTPKTIGQDIDADDEQLINAGGYDHNFIPDGTGLRKIAEASSPKTHIHMSVYSDKPGVQFYSGNFLEDQTGKSGTKYAKRAGFCLETQYYPNAMAFEHFPSIVLHAGDPYHFTTSYEFSV